MVCVITQYEATINRSALIKNLDKKFELLSAIEDDDYFFDADSDDDETPVIENVLMLYDFKNYAYYITKSQGVCSIVEINPRESQLRNHKVIATFHAEHCLAFDTDGHNFYAMDETRSIHVFCRRPNYRELESEGEMSIKEFSRRDIIHADF